MKNKRNNENLHIPVLLHESVDLLSLEKGDIVVDLTVGAGGHSKAFLEVIGKKGKLIAFDQDQEALKSAKETLESYPNTIFIHANFENIEDELAKRKIQPTVIFADIGISSMQLDNGERGFSFRGDAPLDMRMDTSSSLTARDVVETYPADELENIFVNYGEEDRRVARRIAIRIVEFRETEPLDTTYKLVRIIEKTKRKKINKKIHLATQVFQAIRIEVNDELGRLQRMLQSSFNILPAGGRIGIISFHSLEDRIVKQFMKYWARACICPREQLQCICKEKHPKRFKIQKPFPAMTSEEEAQKNPRSRSAKLRVVKVIEINN